MPRLLFRLVGHIPFETIETFFAEIKDPSGDSDERVDEFLLFWSVALSDQGAHAEGLKKADNIRNDLLRRKSQQLIAENLFREEKMKEYDMLAASLDDKIKRVAVAGAETNILPEASLLRRLHELERIDHWQREVADFAGREKTTERHIETIFEWISLLKLSPPDNKTKKSKDDSAWRTDDEMQFARVGMGWLVSADQSWREEIFYTEEQGGITVSGLDENTEIDEIVWSDRCDEDILLFQEHASGILASIIHRTPYMRPETATKVLETLLDRVAKTSNLDLWYKIFLIAKVADAYRECEKSDQALATLKRLDALALTEEFGKRPFCRFYALLKSLELRVIMFKNPNIRKERLWGKVVNRICTHVNYR